MRTTVTIEDPLLTAARQRAAERGTTLSDVVNDALRQASIGDESASEAPPIVVFDGGTGPAPGVDLTSNAQLAEILDEGSDVR